MESVWTGFVALVLSGWFAASVVHQFRRSWWERVARIDTLNLLPRWRFFAPNPGRHDILLVYRDWIGDEPQPWQEVTAPRSRRRWRWFWNPSRYPRKAVHDLANGLLPLAATAGESRTLLLTLPYIGLLAFVMSQPVRHPQASQRQFALVRVQGFGSERRIDVPFVSETHRLSP